MKRTIVVGLCMAIASLVLAADPVPPRGTKVDGVAPGKKGEWVQIPINIRNSKCLICGAMVDRANGDVYILPLTKALHVQGCGTGIWKSTDRGATFVRMDNGEVAGGCTSWSCDISPEGGKVAVLPMYFAGGLTLDCGKTWRQLAPIVPDGAHGSDVVCVDWDDPQAQTIMFKRHEAEPVHNISSDGGKTWTTLKAASGFGIFDAKTLVITDNGIKRSEDGGKTWTEVSKEHPATAVMRKFKGAGYFLVRNGLLVSKDNGKTWAVQGAPVNQGGGPAWFGPVFGKDENHILVVNESSEGIGETTDAGKTWKQAVALPKNCKGRRDITFAYDPKSDTFYITQPNTDQFIRYER